MGRQLDAKTESSQRLSDGSNGDDWTAKALAEVSLVQEGVAGFGQAAQEAFKSEHALETAEKLTSSIVMGLVMARFAPVAGITGFAVRSVGIGLGMSFAWDVVQNGTKVLGAMGDALSSSKNFNTDKLIMRENGGKFCFDTVLMSVGAAKGTKLGNSLWRNAKDISIIPNHLLPEAAENLGYKPIVTAAQENGQVLERNLRITKVAGNDAEIASVKSKVVSAADDGIVNPININADREMKLKELQYWSKQNRKVIKQFCRGLKTDTGFESYVRLRQNVR